MYVRLRYTWYLLVKIKTLIEYKHSVGDLPECGELIILHRAPYTLRSLRHMVEYPPWHRQWFGMRLKHMGIAPKKKFTDDSSQKIWFSSILSGCCGVKLSTTSLIFYLHLIYITVIVAIYVTIIVIIIVKVVVTWLQNSMTLCALTRALSSRLENCKKTIRFDNMSL